MRGPKFSENNGPADQFSRNFVPPGQNFRRTKISVTGHYSLRQRHADQIGDRESVDSPCSDGTEAQYMQCLSIALLYLPCCEKDFC